MSEGQKPVNMGRRSTDTGNSHSVHGAARVARWTTWTVLTGVILYMGVMISREQSRSREATERLFRIVHGSPIATVMCDEHGKIVEYNRAAEEVLGWTRAEMMGQDVEITIAPSHRARHHESFVKAIEVLRDAEEDWRVTKTGLAGMALGKDGKEFAVSFSTRGIRYGDKIEFLAFFRPEASLIPKVEAGPLELPKKIVP